MVGGSADNREGSELPNGCTLQHCYNGQQCTKLITMDVVHCNALEGRRMERGGEVSGGVGESD